MRPFQPGRRKDRPDKDSEFTSSVYNFAHRGIVGLAIWLFRRQISGALARHFTIAIAAAAWMGALVLLAIANRNGLTLLLDVSIYALLGIPLLGLVAWVSRQNQDAWAEEHGRDSEAYHKAVEAGHQDAAKTVMEHDWLLDPPWRRPDSKRKPEFGGEGR